MSKTIDLNKEVSATFDKNHVFIDNLGDNFIIGVSRVKELIDVHRRSTTNSFSRFLRKHKITTEFKKEYQESSWNSEYASLDEFLEDKPAWNLICHAFRWQDTVSGNNFWCDIDGEWADFTEVPNIGIHGVKFYGDKIHIGCQIIDIDDIIGLWKVIQMQSW